MEVTRIAGQEEKQIKNVAAYARVSTLQEEQELSYNSQKEYYEATSGPHRTGTLWECMQTRENLV